MGYKIEKVRLLLKLRDSADPAIPAANLKARTGCKWRATQIVDKALNCLKHQETVGLTQSNTGGLGWVTVPKR